MVVDEVADLVDVAFGEHAALIDEDDVRRHGFDGTDGCAAAQGGHSRCSIHSNSLGGAGTGLSTMQARRVFGSTMPGIILMI